MLRGALIGVGKVAIQGHLPGWRSLPGASIVALAEATWSGPEGGMHPQGGLPCYSSTKELLQNEEVDFVDICTPPAFHAGVAREALERGLHVLCEKPLVLCREDLERLAALACEKQRVLFTVHNWRNAPILQQMTQWLQEGRVGKVRHIRWEVERAGPAATAEETGNWRLDPRIAGGGILVDHGWHAFYLLLEWMGERPHSIRACLEKYLPHPLPVEDTARVTLESDSCTAEFFLTWAGDARRNSAEVNGPRGTLRMEDDRLLLEAEDSPCEITFPSRLSQGSYHVDWFGGVAREFLEEIASPERRGKNLQTAARCLHLLHLARESSRSHAPVQIL